MARIFSKLFMKKGNLPFVMELPPYRMPTSRTIMRHTWEKGRQYLRKMGGIILTASILIWALGYFPRPDASQTEAGSNSEANTNSYMERIGRAIEPVMKPLGFDWRMNAGIIAGTGAKELVVSTMGVLYSQTDESNGEETDETTHLQQAVKNAMTPRSAAAYLIFVLLYFPCLATIAAVRNETGQWRWALFTAVYTTLLAYICSLAFYQLWGVFV